MYIKVDHGERSVSIARKKSGASLTGIDGVALESTRLDDGDALKREIEAFVHAVRSGAAPAVTGADGIRSHEVARRITACIAENRASLNLP